MDENPWFSSLDDGEPDTLGQAAEEAKCPWFGIGKRHYLNNKAEIDARVAAQDSEEVARQAINEGMWLNVDIAMTAAGVVMGGASIARLGPRGLVGAGRVAGSRGVKTGAGLVDDVVESSIQSGTKASRLAKNKISGDTIRDEVAAGLKNAVKEVYMTTSRGGRRIDVMSDRIAHEVKSGRVSKTQRIVEQVLKDAELLRDGTVKGVKWVFREGKTGSGPTPGLRNMLREHGIQIVE